MKLFAGGILAGLSVMACTQAELIEPEQMKSPTAFEYVGDPTDCYLDLSVDGLVTALETKAGNGPVNDTEAEREVDNLWLFQFDENGTKLVSDPQYITISADNQQILRNIPITLSDNGGEPCILYVVTNTGDESWVTYDTENETYTDFSTLEELKAHDLPTREPIWETDGTLSIPMGGSKGEDEKLYVKKDEVILVPVKRMYAKIVIDVNIGLEEKSYIYNVQIGNVPQYCRVETLSDDVDSESEAATYPDDVIWISRTFQSKANDDTSPYVVYVPENLQGLQESESNSKDDPGGSAFYINVALSVYDDQGGVSQYPYIVYPGADIESDYNIRRNVVYYITFDINALSLARIPSANCFVVTPGETLSFYPYYREETGGGYDFENFLDPSGLKGKKIDHLAIVWQTKDCIGDNSRYDLVWLSPDKETHDGYEKIYVTTKSEGNALIAAYDDGENGGEIIWSWHIWVTDNDPANESNAVTYYTYRWDSNGIKYDEDRISGYQIMSCNLGALADEPEDDPDDDALFEVTSLKRTHGMLYQWGRKDPFPPFFGDTETDQGVHEYDDDHTPTLYGNDNTTVVHKTSADDADYLFHSAEITSMNTGDGIKYSINNPTVFMCGTNASNVTVSEGSDPSPLVYVADIDNYHNNGAWSADDHDDGMWGATDRSTATSYDTGIQNDLGNNIHIYDNYGDQKSIFDPCPYGWRVPPSDLWLGFTKEKPNPESGDEDLINYNPGKSKKAGMYLYLGQTWREGDCAFFPNQGFRLADGCAYRANTCGNYLNAMTDDSDRVNITHIHNSAQWFNLFETQLHYTVKADGNPVRCVRDKK